MDDKQTSSLFAVGNPVSEFSDNEDIISTSQLPSALMGLKKQDPKVKNFKRSLKRALRSVREETSSLATPRKRSKKSIKQLMGDIARLESTIANLKALIEELINRKLIKADHKLVRLSEECTNNVKKTIGRVADSTSSSSCIV